MINKITLPFFLMSIALVNAQEVKTDSLEKINNIQEVIVKSQRKKQYTDKAVYTFGKEAVATARHSQDLLATLPELNLDAMSNTITNIKGGKTIFLINGIEATAMQFRAVAPENVVKVEYFDIVPTRWEGKADAVVNMITRNPEHGLSYGADIFSSPSTGFLNASTQVSHTRGKHDFGAEYQLSLRDYDNRVVNTSYEYLLNNQKYLSQEKKRDHFGYTTQNTSLRYTYQQPEKQTFQAKFSLEHLNYFSKGNGENLFTVNSLSSLNLLTDYATQKYLKPTLDLYYANQLGKKDELIINLVGSAFTSKVYENNREWNQATGIDFYNNDMNLIAKQKAFVGEIVHNHSFEKSKLSSGYKISNNFVSNDLTNLAGNSKFDVNYLEQYLYTELSGKVKKLGYRLGAGLTHIHNKGAIDTFSDWTFTPRVVLSYSLKGNQSLRLTSSYRPVSPSSYELSPNVVNLAPNIVKRGNPLLKSQKNWVNDLIYSYQSKYFDFNTTLSYTHIKDIANQYYLLDNSLGGYALTYQNADYYQNYRWSFSGSIKPFGNSLLTIQAFLRPTFERIKLTDGRVIKNDYLRNNINIVSQYKNMFLQYQFNIPTFSIGGAFLHTEENKHDIALGCVLGNWTIKGGMFFMGIPSKYQTKSQKESLVNYTTKTEIFNNKNMFVIGVNYNFSRGKNLEANKKLENETAEAVKF